MKTKKRKIKKFATYWVEGDEGSGQKFYLSQNSKNLVEFLKTNDPVLCGVDYMTRKQFDRLSKA